MPTGHRSLRTARPAPGPDIPTVTDVTVPAAATRVGVPLGESAAACRDVLAGLAASGCRLPDPLPAAAERPPGEWDIELLHRVVAVLGRGLREEVAAAGFDPDLLPVPEDRLLDLAAPLEPGVPLQLRLDVVDPPASLAQAVKLVPGQQWDGVQRRWRIVVLPGTVAALRGLVRDHQVKVTARAAAALREVDAQPRAFAPGSVSLGPTGRVCVRLPVAVPSVADALKRVPSMAWDAQAAAYCAPATRLREAVQVASRLGLDLSDEVSAAMVALDAPLSFDGTLDGLRGVPLTDLHCVDDKRSARLAEFGLHSVFDLLFLVPRRYLDRSNLTAIRDVREGDEVGLLATITHLSADPRKRMVKIQVSDGTGRLPLTYFNAIWQAKRFRVGDEVSIYGKVEAWTGGARRVLSITNPVMDPVGDSTLAVIPIYPQSGKSRVTTWDLHTAAAEAIRRLGSLADPLPAALREEMGLGSREEAFAAVHLPASLEEAAAGRRRLAFDELFRMQAALLLSKSAEEAEAGIPHAPTGDLSGQMLGALPFPLTGAQDRVTGDILAKMRAPHPMHLLLQGDVGAGKTLVAAHTLLSGVESGYQGALMAPTEILATQLFEELLERTAGVAAPDGSALRVEFFSNKLRGKKRDAALAELAAGTIHVAVGTHALLQPDVAFANLGVAVVDEQHRFGVEQRAALRAKGPARPGGDPVRPDMLVMTATPIPRTAAMTVFGDLDVAVLDELPPGRTPIATSWVDAAPEMGSADAPPWPLVREQVAAGRQAYVVCPLVEESEKLQAASAVETFESLRFGALAGLRVGLVHGQQPSEERAQTMALFKAGGLDVLVATTVIEVGVNVPNASVIVVLDCSRFGIAQLHQLRGRVGRGTHASSCVLVGRCVSSDARSRMQALCESTDGFYLSEVDLELRGHGSVFGTAQSGASDLRVADLHDDRDLLVQARDVAAGLIGDDPQLSRHPSLRAEIAAVLDADAREWLTKS